MLQTKLTTKQLLDFLHGIAMKKTNVESSSPLASIIEFVNSELTEDMLDLIITKMGTDFDFHSYFRDMDSARELIEMKKTDESMYYRIVYYESVILNVLTVLVKCPYIIVLNPDNLENSYYLQVSQK